VYIVHTNILRMAVITDDNFKHIKYDIEENTVILDAIYANQKIISLEFVFTSNDNALVIHHNQRVCQMTRLDDNLRTIFRCDDNEIVNVTSESLRNAIDAIRFGFGLGDFAKMVMSDIKDNPELTNTFLGICRAMMKSDS
jgi:hypothetical protein